MEPELDHLEEMRGSLLTLPPMPKTDSEAIAETLARLQALEGKVDTILIFIAKLEALTEQLGPVMEQMGNHPMLKMLLR